MPRSSNIYRPATVDRVTGAEFLRMIEAAERRYHQHWQSIEHARRNARTRRRLTYRRAA